MSSSSARPADLTPSCSGRPGTGFGLSQIPLIGNCCFADQVLLRDQGSRRPGITSFSYWTEGRDSERRPRLRRGLRGEARRDPVALRGGLVPDGAALRDRARADRRRHRRRGVHRCRQRHRPRRQRLRAASPFDDYNNIVGGGVPRAHRGPRRRRLWNVVDETIPDVSQFWTYDPDEFLANPVFSRDYTGQAGAAPRRRHRRVLGGSR